MRLVQGRGRSGEASSFNILYGSVLVWFLSFWEPEVVVVLEPKSLAHEENTWLKKFNSVLDSVLLKSKDFYF